jgi:putative ABC transport system substrate-binding protein
MTRTSRRALLAGVATIGAAAVGLTWLGNAQVLPNPMRRTAIRRIGYLTGERWIDSDWEAFQSGLRELGWFEGQNLEIEQRVHGGQTDAAAQMAAELFDLGVELLVAAGSTSAGAAKRASSTTPIVMLGVTDPVGQGLVTNLARPEGNVTGSTYLVPHLASKQLELFKDVAPTVSRIAMLWNPQNPSQRVQAPEHHTAAADLGLQMHDVLVRTPDDIEPAFETILEQRSQGLRVLSDPVFNQYKPQWLGFAAQHRLPAMYQQLEWIPAGGLMAYVASNTALRRRIAYYIDRILRGASPADLPVEQPTTFEFHLNVSTAAALGLNLSESVMLQVTQSFS